VLITMDLEVAGDHDPEGQKNILNTISSDINDLNLPLTIFLTCDSMDYFGERIRVFDTPENEIGIHGFNHSVSENYAKLDEVTIRRNLELSRNKISHFFKRKAETFRGPYNSTSAITQKVLTEFGIKSDFSVCSQRIDFMNSKGGDLRWLISPRQPYHPSDSSPYKKGDSPLWVIPLSCIGIPFISSVLYIFGLEFMKLFFRILLKESISTNKPIVYLFHSYEFSKDINSVSSDTNNLSKSFLHNLYISDAGKRYELNLNLLRYMLSFKEIQPMNSSQLINYLERNPN
nr:polysaccharide deacetylase family protein [Ignavibacteria bacterium]